MRIHVKWLPLFILLGLASGLLLSRWLAGPPAQDPPPGQVITQEHISGPGRIRNKDFDFDGQEITFRSVSTGEAESVTRIPKGFVPEARAWLQATNGLQGSYLAQFYDGRLHSSYSLQYLHRWGYLYAGGGPILGDGKGLQLTLGGCF